MRLRPWRLCPPAGTGPADLPHPRATAQRRRHAWEGGSVVMTQEEFEEAVRDALDAVPADLLDLMDNVVVLVEDEPPADDRPARAVRGHRR